MNHLGTVELETARLKLRRFTIEDAENMYKNWASEEEVTRFLTWPTHASVDVTRELLSHWVKEYENKNYYNWVIELKESEEIVGNISVVSVKENSLNHAAILGSLEQKVTVPAYLEFDVKKLSGKYVRLPERSELNSEINEQLIVEYYSR